MSATHWMGVTSGDGTELQVGRDGETLLLRVRSDKVHTTLSVSAEGVEWLVAAIRYHFPAPPAPADSPREAEGQKK